MVPQLSCGILPRNEYVDVCNDVFIVVSNNLNGSHVHGEEIPNEIGW